MASPTTHPLGLLDEAIDAISANRLRDFVRELCTTSEAARKHFSDKLLVAQALPVIDLTTEDADNKPAEGSASTEQKRKHTRQRYEVCEQCNDEYDVETNGPTSCVWHDGDADPDYDGDFWADHDEQCHGTIDSEWARKEFPEGFIWNCCEKIGADAEGCHTGAHVPGGRKKARSLH
ncbi:hypothetical protein GGTG_02485 [Gaeumannomyces tritici R3-111a-1]|uniref:C2H2-type domain-containing protein n=1 Tax=Gaeumannomyces tritici (strain R3-111a-1) TaxID=644352 RepID=J3NMH9_GAET3|nr:hypothetical protein GGTG_02485 [Gaeumannomyces tritici R3-111a-1]EJT82512.1 hypothetical protein GGTG_02485 [Gaeumannomyces tritici R3-111a-1]